MKSLREIEELRELLLTRMSWLSLPKTALESTARETVYGDHCPLKITS